MDSLHAHIYLHLILTLKGAMCIGYIRIVKSISLWRLGMRTGSKMCYRYYLCYLYSKTYLVFVCFSWNIPQEAVKYGTWVKSWPSAQKIQSIFQGIESCTVQLWNICVFIWFCKSINIIQDVQIFSHFYSKNKSLT